jgi:hypothetical protein
VVHSGFNPLTDQLCRHCAGGALQRREDAAPRFRCRQDAGPPAEPKGAVCARNRRAGAGRGGELGRSAVPGVRDGVKQTLGEQERGPEQRPGVGPGGRRRGGDDARAAEEGDGAVGLLRSGEERQFTPSNVNTLLHVKKTRVTL